MNNDADQGGEQPSKKAKPAKHSKHPVDFPVVGLGASAGGLKALLEFFEHMPADSGMVFVVILHLSPKHESNAAAVLQNVTGMPVMQVTETVKILPNHVYVIPPTQDLSMNDGVLQLSNAERPSGRHVAIDLFFRTLADTHKERAICVVLSGTGSDGTVGLTRIKEMGGVTIAQTPTDAEYDSMPRSAIGTGMVDFVLPVVEIPQRILQLWQNANKIELPPMQDMPESANVTPTADATKNAEEALRDILTLLRTHTGHDFTHYKRATVLRRIERRLQVNHLQTLPQYREYMREHTEEARGLLRDLLISVTNFFRDREAFEALEREVIPQLLQEKRADEQVRVWVPACASGEEAYSITMLLTEYAAALNHPPQIQVFATDLDDQAIATAREGAFPESIVTDVPPTRLRSFFTKEPGSYRIRKGVREKILFATHNLLKDPPFSKLDLVSCRNLLIYLTREVQAEILELLHFSMRPGGYLFLGSSESADARTDLFTPVDKKHRIYRATAIARTLVRVPTLPLGSPVMTYGAGKKVVSERRKISFSELHQQLLEQYAPPSVIVNLEYDIVHLSDRAERFLQFAGGEPSHNLLKVIHPELRLDLRTAFFQATQTGKSVEARRVQITREGRSFYVNMIVRPVHHPETASEYVLVLFDEVEDTLSTEAKEKYEGGKEPIVHQLEEELHRTKEQLQGTIEQYETSTEELKASNEELQAINEELRSATEELETSKEELQSVNEELTTVNQELKNKVEETGKINDDLQNLIASTDIATIFVDRNMRIKRYTPPAAKIFNIIPTDVGRSLLDITHRLDYEKLADDAAEAFDRLRLIEREVQDTNGNWYLARLLPYRTTEDRIDGAVIAFIDMSRRRQLEETLRSSEERLRLIVESAKDYAIITLDREGRITTWSPGAEQTFGFTEQEALGQSCEIIFTPEDRAAGVPAEELKTARKEGRATDERWHERKDGTRVFCSGVMTPLLNGALKGYVKIARDLTGSRQLAAAREELLGYEREARSGAELANRLKDEFLAILSHELKHPLNLMRLSADILNRAAQTEGLPVVRHAAENISQTVTIQAKLIDDLLDFSRLHTGKFSLYRKPTALAPIIAGAVEIVRADAINKQINLEVALPDQQADPLVVEADSVRIEQIVWNLVSNAIKFTPEGGSIQITLEREGEEAKLMVRDNGRGITPEFLPHVFDMFRQGDAGTTKQQGGLGVGLALVRQLVELHGGRVAAESAGLGKGALFTVWLPLYSESSALSSEVSSPDLGKPLKGLRLLVVDDDSGTVEMMRTLLEIEGATVTTATSAAAALRLTEAADFDLLISDVAMPDEDGYQLVKTLRGRSRNANIPAIALTGFGRTEDIERAFAAGFSSYLKKPIEFDALIKTVRATLQ